MFAESAALHRTFAPALSAHDGRIRSIATRQLQKPCRFSGEIVTNHECKRRAAMRSNARHDRSYVFRIDPDSIIDATDVESVARCINHSCEVRALPTRNLGCPSMDARRGLQALPAVAPTAARNTVARGAVC